ncbi:MAG: NAD(P)-binding domain-containing protein [Myxococcales bacterium]|nr:NAD(P)-binding domain-containing protein [Myxococcales bacterium]
MAGLLARYARWLHTGWPAGTVEKLPVVAEDGSTNVPGVYVVGDLTGIPLLKFSADSGARAVQRIAADPALARERNDGNEALDVAIIGAGVSGGAAAIEAKKAGLKFAIFEANQTFSTIKNFPKGKPIYTYPTEMVPTGDLQFHHQVKEPLVEDLDAQLAAAGIKPTQMGIDKVQRKGGLLWLHRAEGEPIAARRVIIGIGRSGSFRKLGVPGEDLDKVFNRLHDPQDFAGHQVLVVGGGDSAIEAAIALTACGADVTLSYRKAEFARPKPDNLEKLNELLSDPAAETGVEEPSSERVTTGITTQMLPKIHPTGSLRVELGSKLRRVEADAVELTLADGSDVRLQNDAVFPMIGREPPLGFFRRSNVRITGEWTPGMWVGLIAFFAFCTWIYHWKSYYWFPVEALNPANWTAKVSEWIGAAANDKTTLLYTVLKSASGPSFYYTLLYSSTITIFGIRRIRRRPTPYVKWQTITLMAMQWLPLFILPEIILPWMGRNGFFSDGAFLKPVADALFETYDGGIGEERAYWRAYGFILAWPLMVYNWFTDQPIWGWLVLGGLQTFVFLPLLIRRFGKGVYCGWMCSCGALAETLGDTHRHKMPHGPKWNRLNMLGQGVLALALILMGLRIVGWIYPDSYIAGHFSEWLQGKSPLSYKWFVDIALAGFLGVSFYFHFSGRVWCRFACPLAALMHIYARFTRFRIFPEKKKCISCNVCTSVCHQGIDIMNFANKGLPMADPECVRCSACVQSCPTGVLRFGRLGRGGAVVYDRIPASLVQLREDLQRLRT